MVRNLYIFTVAILCTLSLDAQVYTGENAEKIIKGAREVWYNNQSNAPALVKFRASYQLKFDNPGLEIQQLLEFRKEDGLVLIHVEHDQIGFRHFRYQQTYKGIPVEAGQYIAHFKNNQLQSVNGVFFNDINIETVPTIDKAIALQKAIADVGAEVYKWEMPEEEAVMQELLDDPEFSYDPDGALVIYSRNGDFVHHEFRLAYKFDIYAHQPESRAYVFVDAHSGDIIGKHNLIHTVEVPGTAVTRYSGTREIVTDSISPNSYRLREAIRGEGSGMYTLDAQRNNSFSDAVDFYDDDNYWDNVNANIDEAATDAHWAAEKMYDYLWERFQRNSIDNAGYRLVSYVHFAETAGQGWNNASFNGISMRYGDGTNGKPYTVLDIGGHEIAHGLTSRTARLIYQDESGALNESFSDIFGTALEYYAKPSEFDYLIGEDRGAMRSMRNPKAGNDPANYKGEHWYTGDQDNGGVHINSGVQNHWFYLLAEGDTGTNEFGEDYSIAGIGIEKAEQIAYRTLVYYLTSGSNYRAAYISSVQAAEDLYGTCSDEVIATINAWYAVNVGDPFLTPLLDVNTTSYCATPVNISFKNNTLGAETYEWSFGDGTTSNEENPCHEYADFGTYDIKLTVTGCGVEDTLIKTQYIKIEKDSDCLLGMPAEGEGCVQTACTGTLLDNGLDENYLNNKVAFLTIAPPDASYINLRFRSFSFEEGMDYLGIYNGDKATPSASLGIFTGNELPDNILPGLIMSDEGTVTLRQSSDQAANASGFELNWYCVTPNSAPEANFTSDIQETCTGVVGFKNVSGNNPTQFIWDFGDGTTSKAAEPIHTYGKSGVYDVKLIVSNNYGSDSILKKSYVTVIQNTGPKVISDEREGAGSITLIASGGNGGPYHWYNAQHGGKLVHVGDTFVTPNLNQTTHYYVQDSAVYPIKKVGPAHDGIGVANRFNNADRRLYFDVYEDLTLKSVLVFADGEGERTFQVLDSDDNIVYDSTINLIDGPSRVTLNASIPKGMGYQFKAAGSDINLNRNSSGASYPYTIEGLVSITGTDASSGGYYYYFYDWEVQQKGGCVTERSEAVATIISLPEDSASAGIYVFPNPAKGFVKIEAKIHKGEKVGVELYDMLGKIIYAENEKSFNELYKKQIDLFQYVAGVYFLKIKIGERQYVQKLVKE